MMSTSDEIGVMVDMDIVNASRDLSASSLKSAFEGRVLAVIRYEWSGDNEVKKLWRIL